MAVVLDFIPTGADGAAVAGSSTGIGKVAVAATVAASTLTYSRAYPLQPPASWQYVGQYGGLSATPPAPLANAGMSFELELPTLPSDPLTPLYLAAWRGNGVKIGDLSVTAAGAIRLRDLNAQKVVSPDGKVASGQRVRFFVAANPGSASGHQVKVFVGANRYGNTPDWDSGTTSATGQTGTTVVDSLQLGETPQGTYAVTVIGGRIRITDDGTDPGSGYTSTPAGPVITTAVGSGTVTLSWPAAAGQTGALLYRKSGSTPYALAPVQPAPTGTTVTDTTVANGTAYTYMLRLSNASGYGVGGVATATPVAASSQSLPLTGDVQIAGCVAVNPAGADLASCTTEAVPDSASYIEIARDGHYLGELGDPTVPLPAGTVAKVHYVLGAGQTATCVVMLVSGSTVIATDDERSGPGDYTMQLTAAQTDQLNGAAAAGLRLLVADTQSGPHTYVPPGAAPLGTATVSVQDPPGEPIALTVGSPV